MVRRDGRSASCSRRGWRVRIKQGKRAGQVTAFASAQSQDCSFCGASWQETTLTSTSASSRPSARAIPLQRPTPGPLLSLTMSARRTRRARPPRRRWTRARRSWRRCVRAPPNAHPRARTARTTRAWLPMHSPSSAPRVYINIMNNITNQEEKR
jgi:hypothetical protein